MFKLALVQSAVFELEALSEPIGAKINTSENEQNLRKILPVEQNNQLNDLFNS